MLNISEHAVMQLKEFRARRGPNAFVRVGILSGSGSGPSLGITIDDKLDTDEQYSFDDLTVIIDRALLSYCETIDVEYVLQEGGGCGSGAGFKIVAKNPI